MGPDPLSVTTSLSPGGFTTLQKCVQTPEAAGATTTQRLQLYLLADVTGSMSSVVNTIKADAATLVGDILTSFPNAEFAAGYYRDFPRDSAAFTPQVDFGAEGDPAGVLAAINSWSAGGGYDGSEGQFYALHRIATAGASVADWDPAKVHVLVWFGDAPGHDPVCAAISGLVSDITEASVTADLQGTSIIVVAISTPTGYPQQLNDNPRSSAFDYSGICTIGGTAGQATRIAAATGGLDLLSSVAGIVDTIVTAVETVVPATVTVIPIETCDDGLDVSFNPPIIANVLAGGRYCMTERISADASFSRCAGTSSTCSVHFVDEDGLAIGPPQQVSVEPAMPDVSPPDLSGVPGDLVLEYCDPIPLPADVTATDGDCVPLDVDFEETNETGECVNSYDITRTWTAEDICGNEASASQTISVRDTLPPTLHGVPGNLLLDACPVTLPAAPTVTAVDCDDTEYDVSYEEAGPLPVEGECASNVDYERTWTATDACGNVASATQTIHFKDLSPPVYPLGSASVCIWSPNHKYILYENFLSGNEHFKFNEVYDACGLPVTVTFKSCLSSQPDNGLGDGNTSDDCIYDPATNTLKVRSERTGLVEGGRYYYVNVDLEDSCGNVNPTTGSIWVPHDVEDFKESPFERNDCQSPPTGEPGRALRSE